MGWGGLQLGAHVHHVGEEPVESELHLHPAGEGHHLAHRLWKGRPSGVSSSEGPTNTSLQTGVPEGHGDTQPSPAPHLVALPVPCMAHRGRVPSARQLLPMDRSGLSGTGLPSECV